MSVLHDDSVRRELLAAWTESGAGTDSAHEEGGFVLWTAANEFSVERWPRGLQNEITVPGHSGGYRAGLLVVATFHTHPNPGAEFQQRPSRTDVRAVQFDPDLAHVEYEGEFVISAVVANGAASADGVNPTQSLGTISEEFTDAGPAWRIEYGPRDFVRRRGGELIILVDQSTGDIQRVLHGQ